MACALAADQSRLWQALGTAAVLFEPSVANILDAEAVGWGAQSTW
jgi:hypothetical protein